MTNAFLDDGKNIVRAEATRVTLPFGICLMQSGNTWRDG